MAVKLQFSAYHKNNKCVKVAGIASEDLPILDEFPSLENDRSRGLCCRNCTQVLDSVQSCFGLISEKYHSVNYWKRQ